MPEHVVLANDGEFDAAAYEASGSAAATKALMRGIRQLQQSSEVQSLRLRRRIRRRKQRASASASAKCKISSRTC